MKKIIKTAFLLIVIAICVASICFSFPELIKNAKSYIWYLSGNIKTETDQWLFEYSANLIVKEAFSFASSVVCIFLSLLLAVKVIHSSNLDHAARLTYEEYRERAKQKKLEKTRKKMQELEEKLQKESTE
jgi:hypothetical protein